MMLFVALARVLERRVRMSSRVRRLGRGAAAALAKRSVEARSFVALRLMKLV
jgi:hypothetical protein